MNNIGLEELSFKKQLLFGVCLTERMMHFYKDFDEVWEESYFETANNTLEELYNIFLEDIVLDYEKVSERMISIIPDSEEYEDQEALFAQNVGISLLNCIEFALKPELKKIVECIAKIEETLDVREVVVYNNSDKESDLAIDKERDLQSELINILHNLPEKISNKEIDMVRNFAKKNMIEVNYKY